MLVVSSPCLGGVDRGGDDRSGKVVENLCGAI